MCFVDEFGLMEFEVDNQIYSRKFVKKVVKSIMKVDVRRYKMMLLCYVDITVQVMFSTRNRDGVCSFGIQNIVITLQTINT